MHLPACKSHTHTHARMHAYIWAQRAPRFLQFAPKSRVACCSRAVSPPFFSSHPCPRFPTLLKCPGRGTSLWRSRHLVLSGNNRATLTGLLLGTGSCSSHLICINSFNPHNNPQNTDAIFTFFFQRSDTRSVKSGRDSPEATRPGRGRVRVWPQRPSSRTRLWGLS